MTFLQHSNRPDLDAVALRLLVTSDLHSHIYPYDYYADRPANGGLACAAQTIDQLRQEAENTLLLDNGDFLQGSPIADYIAHHRGVGPELVHPMIAAMNLLNYDGANLGNHDFNYGLDFLTRSIAAAKFPIVSANVFLLSGEHGAGQKAFVPPFQILRRQFRDRRGQLQNLRIGLIGFLPPQIMIWDHTHLFGRATVDDIVQAAETYVPKIRAAGADLVIALSHSGFGPAVHVPGNENASLALARVSGIDVILAGHSHKVFPSDDFVAGPGLDPVAGTVFGKPATMPGFGGSHVGVIDLTLHRGQDRWQMVAAQAGVRPASPEPGDNSRPKVTPRPDILAATQQAHFETIRYLAAPVGHTATHLHSYFAMVASVAAIRLVAQAQMNHVREALRSSAFAGLPVLAAAAPFKAGGQAGLLNYTDVAPGPLLLRNMADLYSFPNLVAALRVTGAQIAEWLERAVGLFNQLTPGAAGQQLLNPDFPSFNFDMIHGLTYAVDLAEPPRYCLGGKLINPHSRRIRALAYGAAPIDPDAEFIIATNGHRAYGGGGFPGAAVRNVVYDSKVSNRDAVEALLRSGMERHDLPVPWRFVPMPGTRVLFETSPLACDHLADLAELSPTQAGIGPRGFAVIALAL